MRCAIDNICTTYTKKSLSPSSYKYNNNTGVNRGT